MLLGAAINLKPKSSASNFSPFELATGQQPLTPHTVAAGGGLPISLLCQDVAGAQRPSPNLLKLKALMSNKKTEENNVKQKRTRSYGTIAISFLFFYLSSIERGDDTWRGIPDRLVNETYVSRHSSIYIYILFFLSLSPPLPGPTRICPRKSLCILGARAMNLRKISSGLYKSIKKKSPGRSTSKRREEKQKKEGGSLNTSHWTRGAPNPPTHSSITVFS